MDLFAEGELERNLVTVTPDLLDSFTLYWSSVMPLERRGILAYPFFHLRSEGFWHLVPRPGKEVAVRSAVTVSSTRQLQTLVLGAKLDDALLRFLLDPGTREALRAAVLERYFAPEVRSALAAQAAVNVDAHRYSEALLESARADEFRQTKAAFDTPPPPARNQGFRRAVVSAYDHRCGLCGIRMVTPDAHTAVEACHIVPWSISQDDDLRNGLGLCRLCHWTFDEGLVALSDEHTVLAARQLSREPNLPAHLASLAGRLLLGPEDRRLWPSQEAMGWHRGERFRRR
jgi:putative restriction endonuclease